MRDPANSPPPANSSTLFHSSSALRVGISARRLNEPIRSTGGRLSACFIDRSSRQHPLPLASSSRRSSTLHPKMRRFRSAALHKLRTNACVNEQVAPQSAFRHSASPRSALSSVRPGAALVMRRSPQAGSQLAASTNRARSMLAWYLIGFRSEGRFLFGIRPKPVPKIGSLDDCRLLDHAAEAARPRRRGFISLQLEVCTGEPVRGFQTSAASFRLAFRPVHGLPHAAQSFQSRQGTVPLGTGTIIAWSPHASQGDLFGKSPQFINTISTFW